MSYKPGSPNDSHGHASTRSREAPASDTAAFCTDSHEAMLITGETLFKRGNTVIAAANGDLKSPTMIAQSLLHHRGRCRLSSKPILVVINSYVWDWSETTIDPNQSMQHADEFRWKCSSFCSACFICFLHRFGRLSALIVPV